MTSIAANKPLGPPGAITRNDYALSLKVMRLRNPEFFVPSVHRMEETDLLHGMPLVAPPSFRVLACNDSGLQVRLPPPTCCVDCLVMSSVA